uniref:Protein MgtC n=1 Tax=uncultured Thiotrichaceae bacterium TaxID=298394 RepID=A0A6S6UK62_9GAMM|nr:MAG: Protein MgtC [uncultured Thiotrichaceae bacterium]
MSYALSPEEVALRLGVAVLCGLFIGLDREVKRKSVGVRTFLLVCLGAAGFTITVIEVTHYYIVVYEDINPDPTRIVQGIVTGIGFLGGGAILQSNGHITGAATGASIWVSGCIGVACGYGFYWHALIFTAYAFAVLVIAGYLRAKLRDDIKDDTGNVINTDTTE